MKKHAIIPIFIPHLGCPHDCVFCNQRKITAHIASVSAEDIARTVDDYMSTLSAMNLETIELSFFGGSFTGLPLKEQSAFLAIARAYKEQGVIEKVMPKVKPDTNAEEILAYLGGA